MAKKNSYKNQKSVTSIGFSTKRKKAQEPIKKEKERLTRKQIIILIAVAVMAVAVSAGIIIAVLLSRGSNNPDLLKADLTKYITISKEDYKNIDLNIPLEDISDEAVKAKVETQINSSLTDYKTLNEEDKGAFNPSRPLSLGDTVDIFYRGYTVDGNGRQKDFDGGSNISGTTLTTLEVGTGKTINPSTGKAEGSFIPGFAEQLVGIVPEKYSRIFKIRDSFVEAGDVVYISYTVLDENNNETVTDKRIDLSLSYIDEMYGEGFSAYLIGKKIGEDIESKTFKKAGQTDVVYSDMKVSFVTRGTESKPVTIKVRFPADYQEESLRGKETYFDIFIDSACCYDVPELDDKFITENLKVRADRLTAYPGATLAEKYRAKLISDTKKELEDSNVQLLSNQMWSHLMSKVTVKKLPKKTLEKYYDSYYSRIKTLYNSGYYSEQYSTLDDLAIAYLNETYGMGLSKGGNWKQAINELAEWDVTQALVFYYIIREENMLPTDEEYQNTYDLIYNDMLEYYIDSNNEKLYSLDSAAYQKEIEVLKSEIDDAYGEEYFREEIYKYFGTRKIIAMNTK